jgi:hypothetical protein
MPPGGTTPDENDHWPSWGPGDHGARALGDEAPSYDGLDACQWESWIFFERVSCAAVRHHVT